MQSALGKHIADYITNLNLERSKEGIDTYDGNIIDLLKYLAEIEKHKIINNYNNANTIKLILLTTTGITHDYVLFWQLRSQNKTWLGLRKDLIQRYKDAINDMRIEEKENIFTDKYPRIGRDF